MKSNKWTRYNSSRKFMHDNVLPNFKKLGTGEYEKLSLCGKYINVIVCKSCRSKHFAGYTRCKLRWCVNCNHVKTLLWVARLYPVFQQHINSGHTVHMLNFTIRDVENLTTGIKILNESFRSIYNNTSNRKEWKKRFIGGIRSLEVKIGKNSGKWHPHLHALVIKNSYSEDYSWLKDRWETVTSHSFNTSDKVGSIYLKQVDSSNHDIMKSILETLKYIIKPDNSIYSNFDLFKEMYNSLKGVRQINTWGCLRGLSKNVDEDFNNIEEKKLSEFVCSQCGCTEGELKSILYETLSNEFLYDL